MLPCRGSGQERRGKPPIRYASPEGGLDPIALEPTDGTIRTQWIRNPIWRGLTHGTDTAGRYDQLPNQYFLLLAEYPEVSDMTMYGTERDFQK